MKTLFLVLKLIPYWLSLFYRLRLLYNEDLVVLELDLLFK